MSEPKDILPPELIKDKGSLHPINHMKDFIMNLLVSFGFEIVDGPFSDKQEAIQAAISQRNNNDWFGEESESEKDETFGKLPPFNSAQLGNYDNDDEYLIQVMTQKEFEEKVENNIQTVQDAHKKKLQKKNQEIKLLIEWPVQVVVVITTIHQFLVKMNQEIEFESTILNVNWRLQNQKNLK